MINILVSCAGRRRYIIDYLDQIKEINKIVVTDASDFVSSNKSGCIFYKMKLTNHADYISDVKEICIKENIDLILSLNDVELLLLSNNKKMFEEIGVKLLISDFEKIQISMDKFLTFDFLNANNILTPKSYISIENFLEDYKDNIISFPVIVKPRFGSGSLSILFANNYEELLANVNLVISSVKESYLNYISSTDDTFIIQEFIHHNDDIIEFGCDILNDFNGKFVHATIKKKIQMRSGETDKCISYYNPKLFEICKNISHSLSHIGNLDIDILFDGTNYFVLELNPRFGGGYPFTHKLGNNYIEFLVKYFCSSIPLKNDFKNISGLKLVKSDDVYVV